jgi:hypothetical protein
VTLAAWLRLCVANGGVWRETKEATMTRQLTLTAAIGAIALLGIGCSAPQERHSARITGTARIAHIAKPAKSRLRTADAATDGTAQLTTFTSYADCCPDSPTFDPNADTSECDDDNACAHLGDFAAIGHQSFDFVQNNDLIAFYDDSDPDGVNFLDNYGGKTIQLTKDGNTFNALIADTCGNDDCDGCCTQNSQGGFLVDMEFWTTVREIGGPDNADGTIDFVISD